LCHWQGIGYFQQEDNSTLQTAEQFHAHYGVPPVEIIEQIALQVIKSKNDWSILSEKQQGRDPN
jgi:hypothetical protein